MSKTVSPITAIMIICLFLNGVAALAGERFTDNEDGTVTDHELGLMWSKTDNQGDIDWKQAEKWVKYTFPYTLETQYEDWRLPTLEELKSLYLKEKGYEGYDTDCGQRVKITPEINLSCGWVWTSEKRTVSARVFNFHRGYHYTDRMVHKRAYRALPVRDLK
ncbi:DUF1566 domain-containing protein [Desulfobacterales bacterium HSG2]|nr:DUF1566 domain-containing protein [Desulfobacterales bacterium HSG2]